MNTLTVARSALDVLVDHPKMLVVADSDAALSPLKLALASVCAQVLTATSGPEALRLTFAHRPDIILVDISLTGMDGLAICQRLRDLSETPIIMVATLDEADQVGRALAIGADDYVTKPLNVPELLARVQACLQRVQEPSNNQDSIVLGNGDLIIDFRGRRAWVRKCEVHLTRTEFSLLVYMGRHRGRVLPHTVLIEAIWGEKRADGRNSLKQCIASLRRKIEVNPRLPLWLVSEHGVGYSLTID